MKCIILCGGYATRLYPLTVDRAKSLLPINGKPLLNHICSSVESIKCIDEIFVVTNNKFYKDFIKWKNSNSFVKKIKILNDGTSSNENRLGGIGDLWFVLNQEKLKEDVLVLCGDNYFNFNLNEIIDFFNKKRKCANGSFIVSNFEEAKKFGVIEIKGGEILSFEEKPRNPKSKLVSAGIYLFAKEEFKLIEEYIESNYSKDGPGNLISYFLEKSKVYAFPLNGFWHDIGSIETYRRINS